MTRQLEDLIRDSLNRHAAEVSDHDVRGPARFSKANAEVIDIATPTRLRSTHTWRRVTAVLAIAAALIASTVGVREVVDHLRDTSEVASTVPVGMRAVSYLGVEIYVPQHFRVVDSLLCPAGDVVAHSIDPQSANVRCSTPYPLIGTMTVLITGFATATATPPDAAVECVDKVLLGNEYGCITITVPAGPVPVRGYPQFSISWPLHDVAIAITMESDEIDLALQILRSAHKDTSNVPSGTVKAEGHGLVVYVPDHFLDLKTRECERGDAVVHGLTTDVHSCPAVPGIGTMTVYLLHPADAAFNSSDKHCDEHIKLGTEAGCLQSVASKAAPGFPGFTQYAVVWPKHNAAIQINLGADGDTALALQILHSVHEA
jgi:hypothetical protein